MGLSCSTAEMRGLTLYGVMIMQTFVPECDICWMFSYLCTVRMGPGTRKLQGIVKDRSGRRKNDKFIDRVAGEIIRLVASVCVCVCVSVRLSVGALLFEPFDL